MKPLLRTITRFTALSLALIGAVAKGALRPDLQLNAPTPEGKVTQLTAQLLEQVQFAHHRLDDTLAAKFLDRYIDSLDGSHELFFQSDIAGFHGFLPQLAEGMRSQGDTRPAHVIFDRYLQRITDTPTISEAGMKNPMEWDTIPSAPFDRFDLVEPSVATLREKSQARIATDRDFAWLRGDIALADKNRASKSVSLNEADRRQELNEAKERTKARDAERAAHQETAPPVYEITVKNATVSGLPAPDKPTKAKTADSAADHDAGDAAEPATNAQDLHLRETEHILADYVQLLRPEDAPNLTQR